MNLATKRQVIECLLLNGDSHGPSLAAAVTHLEHPAQIAKVAIRARRRHWHGDFDLITAAVEAAYRLIESSPTLIREYFERPPADLTVTYEVRLHTVATRGIWQNTAHLCTGRGATPDEAYTDARAQGGAL